MKTTFHTNYYGQIEEIYILDYNNSSIILTRNEMSIFLEIYDVEVDTTLSSQDFLNQLHTLEQMEYFKLRLKEFFLCNENDMKLLKDLATTKIAARVAARILSRNMPLN